VKKRRFFVKTELDILGTSSEKSGLHSSMQFDLLFPTVKTAGLHLIPIKNGSKKYTSFFYFEMDNSC
jgi:hypothetical protein